MSVSVSSQPSNSRNRLLRRNSRGSRPISLNGSRDCTTASRRSSEIRLWKTSAMPAANSRCRAIGSQTVAGVSHPLVISLAVRDFEKSSVFRSNWYQVGSSSEL